MDVKHVNRLLKQRAHRQPAPANPLVDPIAHIKRPLRALEPDRRGQGVVRRGQAARDFRPEPEEWFDF